MTSSNGDLMEQTLTWMTDNLEGAYNAKYPQGHSKAGQHCVNSGTCILVCCYIGALGKVLLKGDPPKRSQNRDFLRFREFLQSCMSDFLSESSARSFPSTPKGRNGGDGWLYEIFRCGFVHNFYPGAKVAWGRKPSIKKYWYEYNSLLTLNIDELVSGFKRGIVEFRRLVAADPELQTRFKEYLFSD